MAVTSLINRNMVNEGIGDSTSQGVARTVGVVESAMTLNVGSGQEFTTLQEALDWVEARVLLAEVTIQIADGTYNMASGEYFNFEHPNYSMVNIIGNETTPANVTFNFTSVIIGFRVGGVTLRKLAGIKVNGGSSNGFFATRGGVISALDNVESYNNSQHGVFVSDGAYIYGNNVKCVSNSQTGFFAYMNATMFMKDAISQNNTQYGFAVNILSAIRLINQTVSGNGIGSYNIGTNSLSSDGSYITV